MGKESPFESEIEDQVCRYARRLGFLAYKFTSPSRRSVPDRLFISPQGDVFFIEFKRKGYTPTLSQSVEHVTLREHSMVVYVVDNVEYGRQVIEGYLR